jgi:hypothetical protein
LCLTHRHHSLVLVDVLVGWWADGGFAAGFDHLVVSAIKRNKNHS